MISVGAIDEVKSMLIRLIDFLKSSNITALFTDLSSSQKVEVTDVEVSSLMDTWILLRTFEHNGERNRGIYVLKSRGIRNSNQVREFVFTSKGVNLLDVYTGPEGVFTGTARVAQEAKDRAAAITREQEIERKKRDIERRQRMFESEIEILKTKYEADKEAP